ncbi:class I SAM-dependent methyltransferase [Ferrovibrio sp.]|uniref:class I SAM-dependent methyltransferase n=1 Tax=Ferrovibrio sp. TaxID=1917215 RepID=UPI00311E894B
MKVNEIRPDIVMAGQQQAMHEDIAWLAARAKDFVEVACPACAADDAVPLYEKYGMQHRSCRSCGTQYVSPRPTAEMLGAFYAQSSNYRYWAKNVFPASRESRRQSIFRPRADIVAQALQRHGLRGGCLVEVGAAHGLFCEEMRKHDIFDQIVAVEPTPDLAEECRALGFETIEAPWEKVALKRAAQVIATFEVIEHLFDPGAFLRWCSENLVAGGHLLLTCPNIAGFETMLLGRESGAVDHEHLNLFNPAGLGRLIEASGLTLVECSTPGELDVELVQRAIQAGECDPAGLDRVWRALLESPAPGVAPDLQALLKKAGLSSNMMILARKAA